MDYWRILLLKFQSNGLSWLARVQKKFTGRAAVPPGLPVLPPFYRITPRVIVCLGTNPGPFTLQGTNTYLVGTGRRRILIDTGDGRESYLIALKECMQSFGCEEIQEVLITHAHYDHVGGLNLISRLRSTINLKVSKYTILSDADGGGERLVQSAALVAAHPDIEFRNIAEGQLFHCEGATLRAVLTPGHTPDHVSFVLEEDGTLFTGDCVLGHGTSAFTSLSTYIRSLHRLAALQPTPLRICPGHGAMVEGSEAVRLKLSQYIAHRKEREVQILNLLRLRSTETSTLRRGLSPEEIAYSIYRCGDSPASLAVLPAAIDIVKQYLVKLEEDGVVTKSVLSIGRLTAGVGGRMAVRNPDRTNQRVSLALCSAFDQIVLLLLRWARADAVWETTCKYQSAEKID